MSEHDPRKPTLSQHGRGEGRRRRAAAQPSPDAVQPEQPFGPSAPRTFPKSAKGRPLLGPVLRERAPSKARCLPVACARPRLLRVPALVGWFLLATEGRSWAQRRHFGPAAPKRPGLSRPQWRIHSRAVVARCRLLAAPACSAGCWLHAGAGRGGGRSVVSYGKKSFSHFLFLLGSPC